MAKARNYALEYARRNVRGEQRGWSKSKSRGHARAWERPAGTSAKPIPESQIQIALRALRQEQSISRAAKAAKISTERLRRYALEHHIIEKERSRWRVRPDLPRRMLIYSRAKSIPIIIGDSGIASEIAGYDNAVRRLIQTNDPSALRKYAGRTIRDIEGEDYVLETRPNVLYRLAAAGDHSFEEIYRIVI